MIFLGLLLYMNQYCSAVAFCTACWSQVLADTRDWIPCLILNAPVTLLFNFLTPEDPPICDCFKGVRNP